MSFSTRTREPERGYAPPQLEPAAPPAPDRDVQLTRPAVLALQRSAGNAAVTRSLQRMAIAEATPGARVVIKKHNQFEGGEPGEILGVEGNQVKVKLFGLWAGATADFDPANLDLAPGLAAVDQSPAATSGGAASSPGASPSDTATATATPGTATATPGAQSAIPDVAPPTEKQAPEHPPPAPKLGMDLASGEKVLSNAFGAVKKIVPGKIELLAQADFQVAYDKIYGAGKYSWDKYIKPTFGNLEGFAHIGVNYINTDMGHLDTIAHEMLHNNAAADWRGVVGDDFNEGATEILTIAACKKISVPFLVSYPGENPVVQAALDAGLPFDDLVQAYLMGGAQAKIADWVDKNCKESFAKVKEYMAAKNWAAAKAALAKKP